MGVPSYSKRVLKKYHFYRIVILNAVKNLVFSLYYRSFAMLRMTKKVTFSAPFTVTTVDSIFCSFLLYFNGIIS